MATSVDPDEMAPYEPSHLDLHYLHKYLFGLQVWECWPIFQIFCLKSLQNLHIYVKDHGCVTRRNCKMIVNLFRHLSTKSQ